jgi:ABC-type Mn2+/Zn2+ transport system ATPase subunit
MSELVISVKGLSVHFGRKRVLSNIFLDIHAGHLYGVIGPNGAGKSTLFKAILGLTEVKSGEVLVYGEAAQKHQKRLVYVPQKDEVDWQFPATVLDIVLMGRYPHKRLWERLSKADYRIAMQALEDVGILDLKERQIGALSGGQQQRVFLARALCQQPDIFLLDEPFIGVDVTTEERIIGILKDLSAKGKTVLVVHHDLANVPRYFDRVILVNHRLIAAGDTATTFVPAIIDEAFQSQPDVLHKTGYLG